VKYAIPAKEGVRPSQLAIAGDFLPCNCSQLGPLLSGGGPFSERGRQTKTKAAKAASFNGDIAKMRIITNLPALHVQE
jgi:hypothetical protein